MTPVVIGSLMNRRRFVAGFVATGAGGAVALYSPTRLRQIAAAASGPMSSVPPDGEFEPTLESLAEHDVPDWWLAAKFGIFVHWGVYSVPAYSPPGMEIIPAEWYWALQQVDPSEVPLELPHRDYHRQTFGEDFVYDDFIPQWRAKRWNPQQWVSLFEEAGAKYFVLVTKHHDGVALWPTSTSDRHTVAMGPQRDIVGELMDAASTSELHPGLYYSLPEWFNPAPRPPDPIYAADPIANLAFNQRRRPMNVYTGEEVPYTGYLPIDDYATGHAVPQIHELVDRYHPSILWLDYGGDATYFRSNEWIAYYYNQATTTNPDGVVVNDRAGVPAHADYGTIEYGPSEPGTAEPFESTRGIGSSFGYNAQETEEHHQTTAELIHELVNVVADGGNFLLNVGPAADGTIPEIQAERLRGIGAWLAINGDAIYASRPWPTTQSEDVRFTVGAGGTIHAIALSWPGEQLVIDGPADLAPDTRIELLGGDGASLPWSIETGNLVVTMPAGGEQASATVSEHAFVLRITRG